MSKRFIITLALIIICILLIATLLIIKFHTKDDYSSEVKERIASCEIEIQENKLSPLEHDESSASRNLENVEFKPFKIYVDLTYMKYQANLDPFLSKHFNKVL